MSLYLDVHPDDTLLIADVEITVVRKSGAKMRIRVTGNSPVKSVRPPKQRELDLGDGGGDGRSK